MISPRLSSLGLMILLLVLLIFCWCLGSTSWSSINTRFIKINQQSWIPILHLFICESCLLRFESVRSDFPFKRYLDIPCWHFCPNNSFRLISFKRTNQRKFFNLKFTTCLIIILHLFPSFASKGLIYCLGRHSCFLITINRNLFWAFLLLCFLLLLSFVTLSEKLLDCFFACKLSGLCCSCFSLSLSQLLLF